MYNPKLKYCQKKQIQLQSWCSFSKGKITVNFKGTTLTYAAQRLEQPERQPETVAKKVDPLIVRAAKQIYRYYADSYAAQLPRPMGIAINRIDMSGKLIYSQLILLPQESFVPMELIELSDYH